MQLELFEAELVAETSSALLVYELPVTDPGEDGVRKDAVEADWYLP